MLASVAKACNPNHTETLYALRLTAAEPFAFNEVCLVTSERGK
jgi:hypothetical protein